MVHTGSQVALYQTFLVAYASNSTFVDVVALSIILLIIPCSTRADEGTESVFTGAAFIAESRVCTFVDVNFMRH